MKFASLCIFTVVAFAAIVRAGRVNRMHPKMTGDADSSSQGGSNQAMGGPMGSDSMMQDSDGGRRIKDGSSMDEASTARRGRGRGRRRPPMSDPSMSSTTSTTEIPLTSSSEHTMQPTHQSEQHVSEDMMSMSTTTSMPHMGHMSSTTSMPTMMPSSASPTNHMNMFPDLDTVEQLQKKQAEEHAKIIAVYKSFKDWVDYLSTNIKGGTLNPVLTRRILEDIRAYQQIILSPHPHRPYTPPHPCDPLRDVWCPEMTGNVMRAASSGYRSYNRRFRSDPSSKLVLI